MEVYLSSILPRTQETIAATRQYALKRSNISESDLEVFFHDDSQKVIESQESSNMTYVTDGSLNWLDPIRPIVKMMDGIELTADYSRWYDTNSFFKRPVIKSEIRSDDLSTLDKYFHSGFSKKSMKAHLPDPYTLAKLSNNKHYANEQDCVFAYAAALNEIVKALEKSSFSFVQLDAPQIVYRKQEEDRLSQDEIKMIKDSIDVVFKGTLIKKSYHTYFGNLSPIYPEILEMPVDYIGVDFIRTSISDLKDHRFTKGLEVGLVDGESTYLESPEEMRRFLDEIQETLNPSTVSLTTSTDLKYLPRSVAEEKIKILGSIGGEI